MTNGRRRKQLRIEFTNRPNDGTYSPSTPIRALIELFAFRHDLAHGRLPTCVLVTVIDGGRAEFKAVEEIAEAAA